MKQQAPKTLPKKAETIENTGKTADILIGAACHKKFEAVKWPIRLTRLYDKNTTVLQKRRQKTLSSALCLLRLYCGQCLPQCVRRCVVINPFQHSGVAVSEQISDQMLRNTLRRPERLSGVTQLMWCEKRNLRMHLYQRPHKRLMG